VRAILVGRGIQPSEHPRALAKYGHPAGDGRTHVYEDERAAAYMPAAGVG
jgi:hypothetical protein